MRYLADKSVSTAEDLGRATAATPYIRDQVAIYMDLAARRVSWSEERHPHWRIEQDIMQSLEEATQTGCPVTFLFFCAAVVEIRGRF